MSAAFPKHIEQALDSYKIPPMSAGFSDRLVKKALGQSSTPVGSGGTASWKRNRNSRSGPWKRGGYIASGVVGFGLVSAAAAAALSLAEIPVRIPIMTDLVEQVLPETSARAVAVKPANPVEKSGANLIQTSNELVESDQPDGAVVGSASWRDMSRAEKRGILKDRMLKNEARVQQRRANNGLPPLTQAQLRKRRAAIRRAVVRGDIPRPVVRREIRRAVRDRRISELKKRDISQANVGDRAVSSTSINPANGAGARTSIAGDTATTPAQPPQSTDGSNAVSAPTDTGPSAVAADSSSMAAVVTETPRTNIPVRPSPEAVAKFKERVPADVRNRLKQATPAERQRMIRDMRNLRKNAAKRRQARQRLRDIRNRAK